MLSAVAMRARARAELRPSSPPAPLDSLAVMQQLTHGGMETNMAESTTRCLMAGFAAQTDAVRAAYVSRDEAVRSDLQHEAVNDAARVELLTRLDSHEKVVQHELERLRLECEKLRTELRHEKERARTDLRYELDKLGASHRLDLNLEKGRARDDLSKQNDRLLETDTRLDRETHALRALIEKEKSDLLRYSIATMAALSGLGLGVIRLIM
jgi:hypothetical protein